MIYDQYKAPEYVMRNTMKEAELVHRLREKSLRICSAESLTGGLFAKKITDIPGSSAVFDGGIISYTNEVKENLLGVSIETIDKYTEVSLECAEEMAKGAARIFGSDIAVSFTGYAGPTGGDEKNPVGTAYICIFREGISNVIANIYNGDRISVREQCVDKAINEIILMLDKQNT